MDYNLPLIHTHSHTDGDEAATQGAGPPIGSNSFQCLHQRHVCVDRTTNPVIIRQPPPANKIDANKLVYIVYLLSDEVGNVEFKYVWLVNSSG